MGAGRLRAFSDKNMLPVRCFASTGRIAFTRNANSFRTAGEQHQWRDHAFLIAQSAGLGLVLSGMIACNSPKCKTRAQLKQL